MSSPVFGAQTTAAEVAKFYGTEMTGRNVLVTGVSPVSLGEETVKALAPYARTIIIASRTRSNIDKVIEGIRKLAPSTKLVPIEVDLSSRESVKRAAAEINALKIPIHIVINNAGVTSARYPELTKTEEGVEIQFAANHLGHFLLNSRIFPAIESAQSGGYRPRIINLASIGHTLAPPRLDDLSYEKRPEEYKPMGAYSSSKLANVLYSRGLAKRYGDTLLSFSLHPGGILETGLATAAIGWFKEVGALNEDGSKKNPADWKTTEQGSSTSVYAALCPTIAEHNGAYLDDCAVREEKASDASRSLENADTLWELSEKLLGEKFGEQPR